MRNSESPSLKSIPRGVPSSEGEGDSNDSYSSLRTVWFLQLCHLRDSLFLRLPWETDFPVSEATGVRLGGVDRDEDKATGKCGVEMMVFVQVGSATKTLIVTLESGWNVNVNFLPSHKDSCIARQWADQIIRQSAERVGLESNVHAHLFIHDYAVYILNCGGPLNAFQGQLGHRDINTIPVCLRPFDEDLKRGFASLFSNVHHPL